MIRLTAFLLLLLAPVVLRAAPNALAGATSPYLRQHTGDPVNWYPWGEEALARARRENKPIFLSSGYSTCHWCHVMKRETFTDPVVAAFLNEHFVAIKLDREERPDLDRIYLTFVAATTGQGGWPLNVWLTPNLEPFLGGTYFPPEEREGLPAFLAVARAAADGWARERDQVTAHAARVTSALRASARPPTGPGQSIAEFGRPAWDAAFARLAETYDPEHRGFGRGDKFPDAAKLHYLLRYAVASGTSPENAARAREIALGTLAAIVDGGLLDPVGGGFHRYTADRAWSTPHYEKMLYDQALVTLVLLDAYQLTGDTRWSDAARSALAFVERELTSPEGAFYSALDAESLPSPEAKTPQEGAYYALTSSQRSAARTDAGARAALLAERQNRPRPHRDEKIIAAWNGYMISAFARAHQVLGDARYLATATRAAGRLRQLSFDPDNSRLHRVPGQPTGFAEDYAGVIQALLDLYAAGFDPRWLDWALALQTTQDRLFWDDVGGGYFNTATGASGVLVRLKEDFDGAEPSANSLSAHNLRRLSVLTGDSAHGERARRLFAAFAPQQATVPHALPVLLAASLGASGKARQIVIAGAPRDDGTAGLLRAVHRRFQPFATVLLADAGPSEAWLAARLPVIPAMQPIDGRPTAYVCENFTCQAPVSDPVELARLLER